jgi:hypothetical protein
MFMERLDSYFQRNDILSIQALSGLPLPVFAGTSFPLRKQGRE